MAHASFLSISLLVSGTLLADTARAEPPSGSAVVVAVESSLGIGGAAKVRAALRRQSQVPVWSASEAESHGAKPGAMLVVELDRSRKVTVLYLDERGTRDALTAPLSPDNPDVTGVVAALAAALLARHPAPASLEGPTALAAFSQDTENELADASRALVAALGRMGLTGIAQRRSGRLNADDF